jgi:hypothetical protein
MGIFVVLMCLELYFHMRAKSQPRDSYNSKKTRKFNIALDGPMNWSERMIAV